MGWDEDDQYSRSIRTMHRISRECVADMGGLYVSADVINECIDSMELQMMGVKV